MELDGEEDFDIEKALNDNWDKIDASVKDIQDDVSELQADNITNKTDITNIKTEQVIQNNNITSLQTDNTINKADITTIKDTLQLLENIGDGEEGLITTILNLQNRINAKLDIPKRKTLTLLSTNWTLNSTTNKYEYIIEDNNITENDFADCLLSLEEQEKLTDLDQYTTNGSLILTTSKQVTEDINMTVVLIRTVAETEVEA